MKSNINMHEQLKNENLKAKEKEEVKEIILNIVIILLCPIIFITALMIGLGTKKEK